MSENICPSRSRAERAKSRPEAPLAARIDLDDAALILTGAAELDAPARPQGLTQGFHACHKSGRRTFLGWESSPAVPSDDLSKCGLTKAEMLALKHRWSFGDTVKAVEEWEARDEAHDSQPA